jgi:hypothetical protein
MDVNKARETQKKYASTKNVVRSRQVLSCLEKDQQ